jgi:hypothetical protein
MPPLLPAYRDLPAPAGYVDRRKFNMPLLISGVVTLGTTYGLGLIYGANQKFEQGLGALAVPVLGPWIALGKRKFDCNAEISSDIDNSTDEVAKCVGKEAQAVGVLVGIGIGELVGTVLLGVGLADRKRSWVRADLANVQWELSPALGPEMNGLVARGSF